MECAMAFAIASSAREPLGEINTTPLIDVLLVLLIVFVMSIPMATHSLDVPLPGEIPPPPLKFDPVRNKVVLTTDGRILWNGDAVSQGQLLAVLHRTTRSPVEPELQFEPEANASYDLSAKVLNVIRGSGVTKFGFVGNERYREFDAGR
jgi:biopolymer transport protein ExbD